MRRSRVRPSGRAGRGVAGQPENSLDGPDGARIPQAMPPGPESSSARPSVDFGTNDVANGNRCVRRLDRHRQSNLVISATRRKGARASAAAAGWRACCQDLRIPLPDVVPVQECLRVADLGVGRAIEIHAGFLQSAPQRLGARLVRFMRVFGGDPGRLALLEPIPR